MDDTNSYPSIGGYTPAETQRFIQEEKKTHRHLLKGELAKNGDVYGGKDWGFLFKVGTKQTSLTAGALVDNMVCYRIRRRRSILDQVRVVFLLLFGCEID